jgi:hypothetical protein
MKLIEHAARAISAIGLSTILLISPLPAAEPRAWDSMTGVAFSGLATVSTTAGKKMESKVGVLFSASAVTLQGSNISVPRQQVKEVVVRERRVMCCQTLQLGLAPMAFIAESTQDHSRPKDRIIDVVGMVIAVGAAVVVAPPLFTIEGIRRLKPSRILLKVTR